MSTTTTPSGLVIEELVVGDGATAASPVGAGGHHAATARNSVPTVCAASKTRGNYPALPAAMQAIAAGYAEKALVQVAYAIGVARRTVEMLGTQTPRPVVATRSMF